jgi:hypothetical protein
MAFGNNQRDCIKHLVVDRCLRFQPCDSVLLALDLIALQYAIHHGYIGPDASFAQSQFLNKPCVMADNLGGLKAISKNSSDISVSHGKDSLTESNLTKQFPRVFGLAA